MRAAKPHLVRPFQARDAECLPAFVEGHRMKAVFDRWRQLQRVSDVVLLKEKRSEVDWNAERADDIPYANESNHGRLPCSRIDDLLVHAIGKGQGEGSAAAEADHVNGGIARREASSKMAERVVDAIVAADAECAAEDPAEHSEPCSDAVRVIAVAARVRVAKFQNVCIAVIFVIGRRLDISFFRVPCPVERIEGHDQSPARMVACSLYGWTARTNGQCNQRSRRAQD